MLRSITPFLLLSFLSACAASAPRVTETAFRRIERTFAIDGQPISAGAIMPMVDRFSKFPAVAVVDVLAVQDCGANIDAVLRTVDLGEGPPPDFEGPPPPRAATRTGVWQWIEPPGEDSIHVGYHLVGRLSGGEWVVETAAIGGGGTCSGVFTNLLLLRFEQHGVMDGLDEATPRLQLRLLATHILGDRSQAVVEIKDGRVRVDGQPLPWPPQ